MRLAVLKERRRHESRVSATPETVRKLTELGFAVSLERGAGEAASFTDQDYEEAGAVLHNDASSALDGARVVLKVQAPMIDQQDDEIVRMPEGVILIGMLNPHAAPAAVQRYAARHITSFSLELLPRITRAQSMDVLSSQSNLAGYGAVIRAAALSKRAFPMMMTAAGTVAPARVLVMGAGVAGLQAIATARRLGAIVSATDVRPAAKEQVQSLGATFVAVEDEEFKQAEAAGGYAKEMSETYRQKQAALIAETLRKQDIVITTALVPGRKAPILIDANMVASMKPGSVIIDLAADQGGNCAVSKPGDVVRHGGVTIAAEYFPAALLATDASNLYARNLLNFLKPMVDKETKDISIKWDDEIIAATALTHGGRVVHASFTNAGK